MKTPSPQQACEIGIITSTWGHAFHTNSNAAVKLAQNLAHHTCSINICGAMKCTVPPQPSRPQQSPCWPSQQHTVPHPSSSWSTLSYIPHSTTAVAVAATHVLLLQVSQALEYTLWSAACESLFGFRMLNRAASVPAAAAVGFYHTPHPGLGPNLTKPAR